MIELAVLLIGIIVITFVIYYKSDTEHFQNYNLSTCPFGYKSYHSNGYVICCNGDILGDTCMGTSACTLNSKAVGNIETCANMILKYYEQNADKCPVQNGKRFQYYEHKINEKGVIAGCTAGLLNNTLTGPRDEKSKSCKIYSNKNDISINKKYIDSCENLKKLEETKCFVKDCEKRLYKDSAGPILIEIKFKDTNDILRTTYTRESYENYLKIVKPNWNNKKRNEFLMNDPIITEVANKFYFKSV